MSDSSNNGNGVINRNLLLVLSTVLASGVGSGSGVYAYMKNITPEQMEQMARPDPATGAQLLHILKSLDRHLEFHPDAVNQYDRRVTRLEISVQHLAERIDTLIENQNEILKRLRQ